MNILKCIALDDEPLALELLSAYCEKDCEISLLHIFTNPFDALEYLKNQDIDLIFLDIEMPDINGIQFYKSLENSPMVIFTTSYHQYAIEGFNLDAIDYLLKPIVFDRFQKAIIKAKEYHHLRENKNERIEPTFFFVRSEYSLVKIEFQDILFIETMDDYLVIHLIAGSKILTLGTMKSIESQLPHPNFIRIHRSYIVSLDKVEKTRGKALFIGNKELPIGSTYEKVFYASYTKIFYH